MVNMSSEHAPQTAGGRLMADLDAALAEASASLGKPLAWDEHEQHEIAAAAQAANRCEILQQQLDAEVDGENRPDVVVKLSAEMRLLDEAITDHLGRVHIGPGMAKSQFHQRAVNARWDRRRDAE
jgi:hypothetical protein